MPSFLIEKIAYFADKVFGHYNYQQEVNISATVTDKGKVIFWDFQTPQNKSAQYLADVSLLAQRTPSTPQMCSVTPCHQVLEQFGTHPTSIKFPESYAFELTSKYYDKKGILKRKLLHRKLRCILDKVGAQTFTLVAQDVTGKPQYINHLGINDQLATRLTSPEMLRIYDSYSRFISSYATWRGT